MAAIELLNRWAATIISLEEQSYIDDDDDELERDILVREDLEGIQFTDEEAGLLHRLDERFRAALLPALHKAGLEPFYRRVGSTHPQSEWWWYVSNVRSMLNEVKSKPAGRKS
jgi:hypothetical protein